VIVTGETLIPHFTHHKSDTNILQEDYRYAGSSSSQPILLSLQFSVKFGQHRGVWENLEKKEKTYKT
jgi:hypothetical protein